MYYSLLYSHRDQAEAVNFIGRLIKVLRLSDDSLLLDLACGRGRHSIILHNLGYSVTGIDLSDNNIAYAKKFEDKGLLFFQGDMRTFDLQQTFDVVFNLFTSFGYFENDEENRKVLDRVVAHLKKDGLFVIDYFNANYVEQKMEKMEKKEVGNVLFSICREIRGKQIVKTIDVEDRNEVLRFEEKVQLITASELTGMIEEAGLDIIQTFGDYSLNSFEKENSERLIIIARRK